MAVGATAGDAGAWQCRGRSMRLGREARRDLREGLASLMLCSLGDYISGILLHLFRPVIEKAPVILALLPAASDARGDVYSSYGSRLSTLLHLGLYRRYFRREIEILLAIIVAVNLWVGLLVGVIAVAMGQQLSLLDVVFLSIASAAASSLVMIPATTLLAEKSFARGLDPDNLVAPISTLFGDIVTIPSIVAAYKALTAVPDAAKVAAVAAAAAYLAAGFTLVYRRSGREQASRRAIKVFRENLAVIIVSTLLSALAGAFMLDNAERLLAWPGVLVVVPAFLEDGGAIAVRFSSKLTTKLHLGSIEPRCRLTPWIVEQLAVNTVHALAVFTSLGVLGASTALLSSAPASWAARVFAAVLLAGITLTLLVSVVAYCLAVVSFRRGLDPDNVLAPLLTSIADILGVVSLVTYVLILARL